jgi:hypothetical protein
MRRGINKVLSIEYLVFRQKTLTVASKIVAVFLLLFLVRFKIQNNCHTELVEVLQLF